MAKTKTSKALKFDGKSAYVNVGPADSLGLTNSDFTVEAWVRVDDFSDPTDKTVMGTDQTGLNLGLHLLVRGRRPYLGFYQNDLAGRTELAAKTWYHITWRYTRDSQEQAIFVNGILDAQAGDTRF